MGKKVLAMDFGASSGRAMLGQATDGKIELIEVHRFSNDPVLARGVLYWDFLRLFYEVKQSLIKAEKVGEICSIGIDTWGVDFGVLNKKGQLTGNPVHYRDSRTKGSIEKFDPVMMNAGYGNQHGISNDGLEKTKSRGKTGGNHPYDAGFISLLFMWRKKG